MDVDEHANQIIVTDYNDNIRVVGELIAALDSEQAARTWRCGSFR